MVDRRKFLSGALSVAGIALLGCGSPGQGESRRGTSATKQARTGGVPMIVHRDAGCGCCLAWAALAQRAGYQVRVVNEADMVALKRRLGVPESLYSCHTALVGGLVIEGHVPMAHIARLRRDRPAGIRGIAVAGMPVGSPGMEVPGVPAQPFQVRAFDAAGRTRPFGA
ncbi:MAG: DUF411 domain-containing protein [Sphingosinicella sp.]